MLTHALEACSIALSPYKHRATSRPSLQSAHPQHTPCSSPGSAPNQKPPCMLLMPRSSMYSTRIHQCCPLSARIMSRGSSETLLVEHAELCPTYENHDPGVQSSRPPKLNTGDSLGLNQFSGLNPKQVYPTTTTARHPSRLLSVCPAQHAQHSTPRTARPSHHVACNALKSAADFTSEEPEFGWPRVPVPSPP